MSWIALGLIAGLLLGTYDFLTKLALQRKDVLETVFHSSLIGGLMWAPFLAIPSSIAGSIDAYGLAAKPLSMAEHLLVAPKTIMMVVTWVLSYYAVKSLPLSISAGVRASGPIWTAIGAIIFFGESLTFLPWCGIAVASLAYVGFSMVGKRESIDFKSNLWVLSMVLATLLSSANALYDKYLIADLKLDLASVQAWSAVQRAAMVVPLLVLIGRRIEFKSLLRENWAIPAIAITYIIAEFVYLWALKQDGAMISVLSMLRRTNLVMVFLLSAIFFRELYLKQKSLAIGGVVAGIGLIILR
jgi:bacterial/archaeal transporter family protein